MLFIFDMGGVVTNTFNINSIYKKLNLTESQFKFICSYNGKDIWDYLTIGKINVNDFWFEFNKRIGGFQRAELNGFETINHFITKESEIDLKQFDNVKQADTDLFRLFFHPIENPEIVDLITQLKKKNRVVCGTNTIQSHWENHLERGDYSYFHQTYASNKIGLAKPDPKFFETILEAEEISADQAYFTDDKIENCKAAESVGIKAVQFTTAQDLFDRWKKFI